MKLDFLNKRFLFVFLGIIVLAFSLRFYKLGEKPFVADEFLGVNVSYGYLKTGQWLRWDFNLEQPYKDKPYFKSIFDLDLWNGGENTYTRAWIYNWQVVQALKLLPDDEEWSYRIIGVVWGVFSVIAVYFVSLKMTGKKTIGIIAAALMALSIDNIEFSRKVRMYIMFMPVFLIFSYYAFKFIESKKESTSKFINKFRERTGLNLLFVLPAAIFGILSVHLHLLASNFLFILFAYFLIVGIIDYKNNRKLTNRYFIYLFMLVVIGWFMNSINKAFLAGLGIQNHLSYFEKSFFDYSNSILAIGLLIIGAYYLLKNKQKEGVFILSSYLVIFFGAMFLWDRNAGSQYIFFAKPFQIILISSGIWFAAEFLKNNLKKYNEKSYLFSILAFLIIVPNFSYFFQEENTYTQTSKSGNPNYKKVFGFFIKEKGSNDILISRNFRNFYWRGSKVETYSLGGERAGEDEKKLTQEKLQEIIITNPGGWLIYAENDEDFIPSSTRDFIEKNLEKVSNSSVRGPISVYRWK